MEDDLDDLLNEVESKFCAKKGGHEKHKKSAHDEKKEPVKVSKSMPSEQRQKHHLDDVIDDILEDNTLDQEKDCMSHSMNAQSTTPRSSSLKQGLKRACDRLRCTDCDFQVAAYDNYQWHSSVDYLFLRNNMPDLHRLKPKLVNKKGFRAYACQCKWKSIKGDLSDLQSEMDLKWVCGKH